MARNFAEQLFPDGFSALQLRSRRERMLFENFNWHQARLPNNAKIIVWTATAHAAKTIAKPLGATNAAVSSAALMEPGKTSATSLGSLVHAKLGEGVAILAFSAKRGSYALANHKITEALPEAPIDSLEQSAFAGRSAVGLRYLDHASLRRQGLRVSRLMSYQNQAQSAEWSNAVDGVVVFDVERPVRLIRSNKPRQLEQAH